MDRAKKEDLLETSAKKYKEIDVSKKKQMLEIRRKKYKEMDASKKKQMLNRKAQQNSKISKLHVDVCISQFCQKIKEGPYYVCTVCNRMLYRKSVLIFNKQKYVNCNIQNIFTKTLSFDNKEYICKTAIPKSSKEKFLAKQYTMTCL